jgi:hypothetical protein
LNGFVFPVPVAPAINPCGFVLNFYVLSPSNASMFSFSHDVVEIFFPAHNVLLNRLQDIIFYKSTILVFTAVSVFYC